MKRAFLFLLAVIFISCDNEGIREVELDNDGSEITKRAFKINLSKPGDHYLKIVNKQEKSVSFKMIFNGNRIYGTLNDIIKDIKKMPDEYSGEPIVRKVWRYTIDNSRHDKPLTDSAFYHIPQIFFNSTGFGFCDDRSMVNNFIWRKLGYESQVWGLGNHVVSEVKVDGKWEMYDSMQEVYYMNNDGKVASVEEIIKDPDIILKPNDPIIEFNDDVPKPYSYDVMMCYMHPDAYTVIPELPDITFQSAIYLGPGYYVQFPKVNDPVLMTATINDSKEKPQPIEEYANFLYCITNSSNGVIPFPFLIHSIEGNGVVSFDQKTYYEAGSKKLEEKINNWDEFNYPVFFNSRDSLKLNYILNPERFSLKKENTLLLIGKNIDSLEVLLLKDVSEKAN